MKEGKTMKYRLAAIEESDIVHEIVKSSVEEVYPHYYPKEVIEYFLEHHCEENIHRDIVDGHVGVLVVGDELVGTGCYIDNWIQRVYVTPCHQGKGYGTFILHTLEELIAKEYATAVLDASLPAAGLYAKLGYHPIQHERYEIGNGGIIAYEIMEKELSAINTRKS